MALSERSKVQLTIAGFFSLCVGLVTSTAIVVSHLQDLKRAVDGGWRIEDQLEYSHQLSASNPSIKVPDSKQVVRERLSNIPSGYLSAGSTK